jgi:uncharacterized protein (TIGR03435 family)
VEGFPDELASYRRSIDAKAGSPESLGMMRGPMTQRLLEERFHLKTHRENRELPAYIMTVSKEGHKLQSPKDGGCTRGDPADVAELLAMISGGTPRCGVLTPPTKNGSHFVVDEHAITVGAFASIFRIGGLPVIERTGLAGTYDIRLEWDYAPGDTASELPDLSIISSIRKQLGLQLTGGKGSRQVLVIDHLERASEN